VLAFEEEGVAEPDVRQDVTGMQLENTAMLVDRLSEAPSAEEVTPIPPSPIRLRIRRCEIGMPVMGSALAPSP
jgi:hypothetical protein